MDRTAPEAIGNNGWKFKEKCQCQRTLKYKYYHPDYPTYELEWWVKTFQFRITDNGLTKVGLTSISQLQKKLSTLS